MVLDDDFILWLVYLAPIFTLSILRSAIIHIFELGKSNTRRKKIVSHFSFMDKLLLLRYVEQCEHFIHQAKTLHKIYWLEILWSILCIVLTSLWNTEYPGQASVLLRIGVVDIPVILFFFIMTKYGKHGGVTWKWEI